MINSDADDAQVSRFKSITGKSSGLAVSHSREVAKFAVALPSRRYVNASTARTICRKPMKIYIYNEQCCRNCSIVSLTLTEELTEELGADIERVESCTGGRKRNRIVVYVACVEAAVQRIERVAADRRS